MRSASRKKGSSSVQDFWPSFTDVMSCIVIILFFVMILVFLQNLLTGKDLIASQDEYNKASAELQKKENDLNLTAGELEKKTSDLQKTAAELDKTAAELDKTANELEQAKIALDIAKSDALSVSKDLVTLNEQLALLKQVLSETESEADQSRIDLALALIELEEQKKLIVGYNDELEILRSKLQSVALLRLSIFEKVKESVEKELGATTATGEPLVRIENANIVINDNVLFATAEYEITKESAKRLIEQLAIAFENILDDEETRSNIETIVIEGHTDNVGSAEYNRTLSLNRARSVLNYMFKYNPDLQNKYGKYFSAAGYAYFRPLDPDDIDSEEARAKNRRIGISIVVKDENITKIIQDYLDNINK